MLAEAQVLQRRGDLVNLLHAGAHWPAADQLHYIAGPDAISTAALDCCDGRLLAGEDARRPRLAVDSIGVHDRRVDGRALDDRTLRGKVAARERYRRGQAALLRLLGLHADGLGINAVALGEQPPQPLPLDTPLPPVEHIAHRGPGH